MKIFMSCFLILYLLQISVANSFPPDNGCSWNGAFLQTYDIPKAQQLLESLLGEAHLMLLFLKTLSAIEVGW